MKTIIGLFAVIAVTGCNITLPKIPDVVKPPVTVTTTTTTTTTQPVAPTCSCSSERGHYNSGVREVIVNGYLPCELRALLDDSTDNECGIADKVQAANAARIVDGKLYVSCFMLPDGSTAHYVGSRQPSSSSPLVKGQGVPTGSGLLRLYFEGRKGISQATEAPVKPTEASSGNVPDLSPAEASKYTTLPRNYGGRMAEQGEFHGAMTFSDPTSASNYRYGLRGFLENVLKPNVATGYAKRGQVNIRADGNNVTWSVMQ